MDGLTNFRNWPGGLDDERMMQPMRAAANLLLSVLVLAACHRDRSGVPARCVDDPSQPRCQDASASDAVEDVQAEASEAAIDADAAEAEVENEAGVDADGGACDKPPCNVAMVSAGGHHSCAVLTNGKLMCWGDNSSGQIGMGTYGGSVKKPTVVPGLEDVVSVGTGSELTCALKKNGTVFCWGWGSEGAIGDGSWFGRSSPTQVKDLTTAKSLYVGYGHACAVLTDGKVMCWGTCDDAECGVATAMGRSVPVEASSVAGATRLALGRRFSCAILADGSAGCWGRGYLDSFAKMSGLSSVTDIAAGPEHVCAVAGGLVTCWGNNGFGQLGDGTLTDRTTPVLVGGISGVLHVIGGTRGSCAHNATTTWCWGDNTMGWLAESGVGDRLKPGIVLVEPPVQMTGGYEHVLVRTKDRVVGWGLNAGNALGIDIAAGSVFGPVEVSW